MFEHFLLKTPIYITDEFGPGEAFLILLVGVGMIFLAKFMAESKNTFISTLGEEIIFKLGIAGSISGLIAFVLSLF